MRDENGKLTIQRKQIPILIRCKNKMSSQNNQGNIYNENHCLEAYHKELYHLSVCLKYRVNVFTNVSFVHQKLFISCVLIKLVESLLDAHTSCRFLS